MRAPAIFIITNYLGFSYKKIVMCNSAEEGKQIIRRTSEYPPKEIIFDHFILFGSQKEQMDFDGDPIYLNA